MKFIANNVLMFSIDENEGDKGYFGNVTILDMKNKGKLEILVRDKFQGQNLKEFEGKNINIEVDIVQNRFGLRIQEVINCKEVK